MENIDNQTFELFFSQKKIFVFLHQPLDDLKVADGCGFENSAVCMGEALEEYQQEIKRLNALLLESFTLYPFDYQIVEENKFSMIEEGLLLGNGAMLAQKVTGFAYLQYAFDTFYLLEIREGKAKGLAKNICKTQEIKDLIRNLIVKKQ